MCTYTGFLWIYFTCQIPLAWVLYDSWLTSAKRGILCITYGWTSVFYFLTKQHTSKYIIYSSENSDNPYNTFQTFESKKWFDKLYGMPHHWSNNCKCPVWLPFMLGV